MTKTKKEKKDRKILNNEFVKEDLKYLNSIGFSMRELAKMFNCSPSTISRRINDEDI